MLRRALRAFGAAPAELRQQEDGGGEPDLEEHGLVALGGRVPRGSADEPVDSLPGDDAHREHQHHPSDALHGGAPPEHPGFGGSCLEPVEGWVSPLRPRTGRSAMKLRSRYRLAWPGATADVQDVAGVEKRESQPEPGARRATSSLLTASSWPSPSASRARSA